MLWFLRGEFSFDVRSLRRFKASRLSLSLFGDQRPLFSISLQPASSGKGSLGGQGRTRRDSLWYISSHHRKEHAPILMLITTDVSHSPVSGLICWMQSKGRTQLDLGCKGQSLQDS
ncbi:hypothetical protein TNCV_2206501 [Trichonephila clavipes]|uniref:Uncharacterized protein n=1 Tax=Trichonephila clavipes TaxID=2585209 RepID=A0A8X6S1N4_TRICX|nr:hypothetical protein TNCV_2206501 [Trichonephila clavipes]